MILRQVGQGLWAGEMDGQEKTKGESNRKGGWLDLETVAKSWRQRLRQIGA